MTIHLTWMTPVWILAGIGAVVVLTLLAQLIFGLWIFRKPR